MRDARAHLHGGDGMVVEEVRYPTAPHVVRPQLIDGDDGSELLRLCRYDHEGRLHLRPCIRESETGLEVLCAAGCSAPRLYAPLTGAGSFIDRRCGGPGGLGGRREAWSRNPHGPI